MQIGISCYTNQEKAIISIVISHKVDFRVMTMTGISKSFHINNDINSSEGT
jgi:hypothetical protein